VGNCASAGGAGEERQRWKEMEKNLTFGADSGGATAQSLSAPQTPEEIFMQNLDYKGE